MLFNRRAVGLLEIMLSVAIIAVLMSVVFSLLGSAQGAFFNAEAGTQLRGAMRITAQKIAWDLSYTGRDADGQAQYTVFTGTGAQGNGWAVGSSVIRFSVPIRCTSSDTILNSSGKPAYWGAYKTWGCDKPSCADEDGDCATLEYKYILYGWEVASGRLVRQVLGSNFSVKSTQEMFVENITGFTIDTSTAGAIGFTLTASKQTSTGRTIAMSVSQKVDLKNY